MGSGWSYWRLLSRGYNTRKLSCRGDTKNIQIINGDHEEGFGFKKNTAMDQHVLARNRHFDLFDILKERPELLGMGIDENTVIVVKGDQFEVIGSSYVLMYDSSFWSLEGSDLKTVPEQEVSFIFYEPVITMI